MKFTIPIEAGQLHEQPGERISYFIGTAFVKGFPTSLPIDGNVRHPKEKPNAQVESMMATLWNAPELFLGNNQGIAIAAENMEVEYGHGGEVVALHLEIPEGKNMGVLNGGHTMQAFHLAQDYPNLERARVPIKAIAGVNPEQSAEFAVHLNYTRKPGGMDRVHRQGAFEPIKQWFCGIMNNIHYFEGQPDVEEPSKINSVGHIIESMAVCDPRHSFKDGKHPTSIIQGGISMSKKNIADQVIKIQEKFLPIYADIFWIDKQICLSITEMFLEDPECSLPGFKRSGRTVLIDGTFINGVTFPHNLALPIIASYRVFVAQSKDKVTWYCEFAQFGEQLLKSLLTRYKKELKQAGARGVSFREFAGNDKMLTGFTATAVQLFGEMKGQNLTKKGRRGKNEEISA